MNLKMNSFEKLLNALESEMQTPTMYGWFHMVCLIGVFTLIAIITFYRHKIDDKKFKIILTICTGILLFFEVYKQLIFSYTAETDTWSYQWYAFPFQFCSTPMYVLLAAVLIKNKKIQNALYSYLATYSLFAGIAVMFYPSTVFIDTVGINIQTMVHHGLMVVIGAFLLITGKVEFSYKTLLKALPVFVCLATTAFILNNIFVDKDGFNMFFIAKDGNCEIPVLATIHEKAPYPVFLVCYVLGFTAVAGIALSICYGIKQAFIIIENKVKNQFTYQN